MAIKFNDPFSSTSLASYSSMSPSSLPLDHRLSSECAPSPLRQHLTGPLGALFPNFALLWGWGIFMKRHSAKQSVEPHFYWLRGQEPWDGPSEWHQFLRYDIPHCEYLSTCFTSTKISHFARPISPAGDIWLGMGSTHLFFQERATFFSQSSLLWFSD